MVLLEFRPAPQAWPDAHYLTCDGDAEYWDIGPLYVEEWPEQWQKWQEWPEQQEWQEWPVEASASATAEQLTEDQKAQAAQEIMTMLKKKDVGGGGRLEGCLTC